MNKFCSKEIDDVNDEFEKIYKIDKMLWEDDFERVILKSMIYQNDFLKVDSWTESFKSLLSIH